MSAAQDKALAEAEAERLKAAQAGSADALNEAEARVHVAKGAKEAADRRDGQ